MHPTKKIAYGWGALLVATGFTYYYTSRSSLARRKARLFEKQAQRDEKLALEQGNSGRTSTGNTSSTSASGAGSASIPTTFPSGGIDPGLQSTATGVDTPKGDGRGL